MKWCAAVVVAAVAASLCLAPPTRATEAGDGVTVREYDARDRSWGDLLMLLWGLPVPGGVDVDPFSGR